MDKIWHRGVIKYREHSAQQTWHVEGFHSAGATAFDALSKHTMLVMSQANLAHFEADPATFLESFLTENECWSTTSVQRLNNNSCSGNIPLLPLQRRPRCMSSAGKVMASFWAEKGIVFMDYLQKGQTITGEYYANLLRQLRNSIKSKRSTWKTDEGMLVHLHTMISLSRLQWLLCVIVAQ